MCALPKIPISGLFENSWILIVFPRCYSLLRTVYETISSVLLSNYQLRKMNRIKKKLMSAVKLHKKLYNSAVEHPKLLV